MEGIWQVGGMSQRKVAPINIASGTGALPSPCEYPDFLCSLGLNADNTPFPFPSLIPTHPSTSYPELGSWAWLAKWGCFWLLQELGNSPSISQVSLLIFSHLAEGGSSLYQSPSLLTHMSSDSPQWGTSGKQNWKTQLRSEATEGPFTSTCCVWEVGVL